MEVNLWRWLFCEDDSRLLLKQRAPEVCIFKGCHLDAWYHSNGPGLFVRRTKNVSIGAALECFLASARGPGGEAQRELGGQTPAALLRRRSSTTLDGGRGLIDAPHAKVLSVQELTEALQRAQNGVEDEDADFWSIQTLVRPAEDLRVLSVYSCDASGLERSEIFGRPYSKLYSLNLSKEIVLPCVEELGADRSIPILADRRATLEAKTLGIVRFASRFHSMEFEGLVLEFVFDAQGHAVLHGCWCSALCGPEQRRKFRSGSVPSRGGPGVPRVFPVPCIGTGANSTTTSPPGGTSAREASPATEEAEAEERCVLLEVWRGDDFLGEAPLPCTGGEQRLRLRSVGDAVPNCTRPDRLKQPASLSSGSISVTVEWCYNGDGRLPLLRFVPHRADGLPAPTAASAAGGGPLAEPRVLLWLRRPGAEGFTPLWASRESVPSEEATSATTAAWGEDVELSVEEPAPTVAAPALQPEVTAFLPFRSTGSPLGNATHRSQGGTSTMGQPGGKCPVELQASLRSAREHVCGAEWAAHWGTSDVDGTMRGSVLATQVTQRLRMERLNRSHLLTQLSSQVEQCYDLQLAWEEQLAIGKAALGAGGEELRGRHAEAARIRKETATIVQEQEKRLSQACREMCGGVDEHRIQEQLDDTALVQSKQRVGEQRTMIHQLVDKSHALQGSLDRTVRKFDEVSTSYAQVQGDLMRAQVVRPPSPAVMRDLDASMGQARDMCDELDREEHSLAGWKSKLGQLQEDLACERDLSLRLEDFVRRIAAAPAARLRTGGGFQLDSTVKSEAAALLRAMGQTPRD